MIRRRIREKEEKARCIIYRQYYKYYYLMWKSRNNNQNNQHRQHYISLYTSLKTSGMNIFKWKQIFSLNTDSDFNFDHCRHFTETRPITKPPTELWLDQLPYNMEHLQQEDRDDVYQARWICVFLFLKRFLLLTCRSKIQKNLASPNY